MHKRLYLNLPTLLAAGIGMTERECVCVCVIASKSVCIVVIMYKATAQADARLCPFQPNLPWELSGTLQ